jgi:hypothetical protein
MSVGGEDVLAGPIVRRVGLDRVSVWIALRVPVENVRLSIREHHSPTARGEVSEPPVRIGKGLYVALPTVRFAAGAHLEPGTIYEYDIDLITEGNSHQNLGMLGLLSNTSFGGHRHLALGYDEGLLPTFVTPARDAARLTMAHGSCRRPYAQGLDAMVALDQVIERGREAPDRPQFLFLTGDQIYADDLSNELLSWANDKAVELVGANAAGAPIEQLRVDLPVDAPTRTVKFTADRLHFPPGRRARICGRAAGLTSDDNQNHALSFGEIAAHYLMSWSNVSWPTLADDATWKGTAQKKGLYQQRGDDVRAYFTAWLGRGAGVLSDLDTASKQNPPVRPGGDANVEDRFAHLDAWKLVPPEHRAIDQFAAPVATGAADDWNSDQKDWKAFWVAVGKTPPRPDADTAIGATSGVLGSKFSEPHADLADLVHALTPTWFAGKHNYGVDHDYKLTDKKKPPPAALDQLEFYGDDVLIRLDRLRCFYEGLPYARRALANVSTLMMFDDHEVTDDFAISRRWRDELRARSLGRDVMTNALAAYLVFQDWGNDADRYAANATTKNRDAFEVVKRMFVDGGQPREQGPLDADRVQLERLFGFNAGTESPLPERVTWNYQITDPNLAPYEILTLDNRTRRGYDTEAGEPSDLSIEAIAEQVPANGPTGSTVTILIAPLPVVGYPPMEELVQPIMSLVQGVTDEHVVKASNTFPNVELDYKFGKLVADPEAWSFSARAQEALLERLSTRSAVVMLSGDIHFSMTGKVTYWTLQPGTGLGNPDKLEPKSRFVQLVSSALKNEPGGLKQMLVQLQLAEQIGAVLGGPFDRLGWHSGGNDGPSFDTAGSSHLLAVKMRMNPAVVPVRMMNDAAKQQLRTRTLAHPPEWAWRYELVKDTRPDDARYGAAMSSTMPEWTLPTEAELIASPTTMFPKIATHHAWYARFGMTRRSFVNSNIGLVKFEPDPVETGALVVVHSLYGWDRMITGPRGTTQYDKPWPLGREPAHAYTQYRVPLSFAHEFGPDEPDPEELTYSVVVQP